MVDIIIFLVGICVGILIGLFIISMCIISKEDNDEW